MLRKHFGDTAAELYSRKWETAALILYNLLVLEVGFGGHWVVVKSSVNQIQIHQVKTKKVYLIAWIEDIIAL